MGENKEEDMNPYIEAAKVAVSIIMENRAKNKQTKEITNEIIKAIKDLGKKLEDFILQNSLENFKEHIKWYEKEYSIPIDVYMESEKKEQDMKYAISRLDSLLTDIRKERVEYAKFFNTDIEYYCKKYIR